MKFRYSLFIASLALSVSTSSISMASSGGGYVDGNTLHSACTRERATNSKADPTFCISYITGSFDMILFYQTADAKNAVICPSSGVTGGQIRDIVVKYLTENPEKRHFPASLSIWDALSDAFPCRSKP